MTKKLREILIASALVFGLNANVSAEGITDAVLSNEYLVSSYTTQFGDETITFEERISPPGHNAVPNRLIKDYHLIVTERERTIEYMDLYGMDLKIDAIRITQAGESKTYYSKESVQNAFIVSEAQRRFDFYLELIKQARAKEVLGN